MDIAEPVLDQRVFEDTTIQKATSCMANGHGIALLSSDEAAKVVGGHSMTPENSMATFGIFNSLWDGSPFRNDRVLSGSSYIASPRLTVALSGQEEPAKKLFGNGLAENTGLIARFLVVQAPDRAGHRIRYKPDKRDWAIVLGFAEKVKALMERPLPIEDDVCRPRAIDVTPEAERCIEAYYDEVEPEQQEGRLYEDFRATASKSVEQAYRIAGILAGWQSPDTPLVTIETMEAAIALARFYLNEAKRFMGVATQSRVTSDADEMMKQLTKAIGDKGFVTAGDLHGKHLKKPFKGQIERAEKALAILEKSGRIYSASGPRGGKRYMLERP